MQRRLFGRRCWELEKKGQKKDVWKFTGKKRKGVYIRAKRKQVNSLGGRRMKMRHKIDVVLVGSE